MQRFVTPLLILTVTLLGALSVPAVAQQGTSIPAAFRGTWHEEPNTRCSPNEGGFLTVTAQGYESPVAEGARVRVQTVSPTSIRISAVKRLSRVPPGSNA